MHSLTICVTHLHLSFITEVGGRACSDLITFPLSLTGRCSEPTLLWWIVSVCAPWQRVEITFINYRMTSLINCHITAYVFLPPSPFFLFFGLGGSPPVCD